MVAADLIRAGAVGMLAVLALTGALEMWQIVALCAVYGAGDRVLRAGVRRHRPETPPSGGARAGERARPAGAADRVPAGRAGNRRLAGRSASAPARPSRSTRPRSSSRRSPWQSMRSRPSSSARPRRRWCEEIREGFAFVRAHAWLWGTLVSAAIAYLAFMGPAEVLLPYLVKNDLRRERVRPGLRVRGRRPGCHPERHRLRLARTAAAQHDLDVSVLDGCDAVDRRLWPRAGKLAADARLFHVQRARNRGNDHLGHGQAAPRPAATCWAESRASTGSSRSASCHCRSR